MDKKIGEIVQTFKASSLFDDTIFVLISSTGGDLRNGGNNWPLRGGKGSVWEGGLRTPSFISNQRIFGNLGGTRNSNLMHISDWLPSMIDDIVNDGNIGIETFDGKSQWKSWLNNVVSR